MLEHSARNRLAAVRKGLFYDSMIVHLCSKAQKSQFGSWYFQQYTDCSFFLKLHQSNTSFISQDAVLAIQLHHALSPRTRISLFCKSKNPKQFTPSTSSYCYQRRGKFVLISVRLISEPKSPCSLTYCMIFFLYGDPL